MKMKWNRYICLACISFALVGCGSKKVLTDTSMQVRREPSPPIREQPLQLLCRQLHSWKKSLTIK